MNAKSPESSRRSFLNSLLAGGFAGIASGASFVCEAGPRDRIASRDRGRRDGQGIAPAASSETGPSEESRRILRESPIGPAAEAVEQALELIRTIPGYTATLIKREQFKSGAAVVPHTMSMKLRREPFSVYFKFIEPYAGREVLYVEGQNKGKLLVHEGSGLASWVGTVSFVPTADKVMEENRYPVTMAGLEKGLSQLLTRWAKEAPHGAVEVRQAEKSEVAGISCVLHEVVHPKPGPHFPMHKVQVHLNPETKLPVRLAGFGYPPRPGAEPPILEEYTYQNLRTDVVLRDIDFDVANRNYRFK